MTELLTLTTKLSAGVSFQSRGGVDLDEISV
jgi:hypothetical protein